MTDEHRAAEELVNQLLTFIRSARGKVSWYTFARPKQRTSVDSPDHFLGFSTCPKSGRHNKGSSHRVCALKHCRVKVHTVSYRTLFITL